MEDSSSLGASLGARLRFVRPLGGHPGLGAPTWAAIEAIAGGKTRLVVVEKVARGSEQADEQIADWIRDVRRLATLEHPNLARVRDVSIGGEEILVTSDYLDGARWSELATREPRPGLEVSLRVLVDVLSGLGAMHNLRDSKREPLRLVHGGLTPEHVIVCTDGTARLVVPCRSRTGGLSSERAGSSYLAPEILLGDESADARADVYGVGVMLWEALTGTPLFAGLQASAIVTQLLSGRVPKATVPAGSEWAAGLVDVAQRALSADPEKRGISAAALAADIRRVAGIKLAPAVRVATYVRGAYGDRVKARRLEIERGEARVPTPDDESVDVDVRVSVPVPEPLPTATTRPPPPVDNVPAVHVAPSPRLPEPTPKPDVPRRPPPVPMRARLPTLEGVAPQAAEGAGQGTPVVVPSSHPPPAAIAASIASVLDVPPPPHVPADIIEQVAVEMRAQAPASAMLAASPVPAMPPMVMPLDLVEEVPPPPRRSRRAVVLIPLLLGLGMLGGLLIWWLAGTRPSGREEAARAAPSVSPVAAAQASALPAPPAASAIPSATVAALPTPPPPSVPSEAPSEAPTPTAATATATASPTFQAPPPVAPPPRPARPKYEPEGI